MIRHINKGTCSSAVDFEVENGIVTNCRFIGGNVMETLKVWLNLSSAALWTKLSIC